MNKPGSTAVDKVHQLLRSIIPLQAAFNMHPLLHSMKILH